MSQLKKQKSERPYGDTQYRSVSVFERTNRIIQKNLTKGQSWSKIDLNIRESDSRNHLHAVSSKKSKSSTHSEKPEATVAYGATKSTTTDFMSRNTQELAN